MAIALRISGKILKLQPAQVVNSLIQTSFGELPVPLAHIGDVSVGKLLEFGD